MIAHRQGFGDLLAEGLLRVGETLGLEAKELFANEVAGVGDGATYSAREYLMNGLLYGFEPRQPIAMLHEVSRLIGMWVMNLQYAGSTPVSGDVYRGAAAKFWGHDRAWDPKKDDTIAEFNFTDPVQTVFMNTDVLVPGEGDIVLSRKGRTQDLEVFKKMRDEFYQLRGWNLETGYPTAEKLCELGPSDLNSDL